METEENGMAETEFNQSLINYMKIDKEYLGKYLG